ncbi:hypothetical protein ACRAWD_11400 [Caulobacter segnis]
MASDQNKPNGQFLVARGQGEAFARTLPISRFYGVGEVTERKMKALKIRRRARTCTASRWSS